MPDSLDNLPRLTADQLASLATEHWRLSQTLGPVLSMQGGAAIRHSLRKIEDILKACEVETRSLDGQPYDPGLAARVVDSTPNAALPRGTSRITETLSPLILLAGHVLRPADIAIATN